MRLINVSPQHLGNEGHNTTLITAGIVADQVIPRSKERPSQQAVNVGHRGALLSASVLACHACAALLS
jgi:hypothetical protein